MQLAVQPEILPDWIRFSFPSRCSYTALGSRRSNFARQAEMELTYCHV